MNKKQKEIIEKIKLLLVALESNIQEDQASKNSDGDWRGGSPNSLPPKK